MVTVANVVGQTQAGATNSIIPAGLFGVPLGFAEIIMVSLLTKAPGKDIQELVEHVRYPSLDGRVSAGSAAH